MSKFIRISFYVLLILCVLCGCKSQDHHAAQNMPTQGKGDSATTPTKTERTPEQEKLLSVLYNEVPLVDETGKTVYVKDYHIANVIQPIYAEPESYEKNTSGIICVKDDLSGLSFVSKEGIHECGVSKSGVISAVMLRGFGRIMWADIRSTKSQMIGKHRFRYGITLETDFTKLYDIKHDLFSKYENVISDDDSDSLLELKGCVCYSIIKVSEDKNGIILRVFNPKNTSEKFTVDTKFEYKNVYESDLSEENLTKLESCSNSIFTEVLPHKIKTLYFEV